MGNITIVEGRAGSGKTTLLVNKFIETLKNSQNTGENAFYIVPEQFAVDIENKILNAKEIKGMIGSEVISFSRFTSRIISLLGKVQNETLTKSGRSMLLLRAIYSVKDKLSIFKNAAMSASLCAGILETIDEFEKYDVTPQIIIKAADKANLNTARDKLYELALIYEKYIMYREKSNSSDPIENFKRAIRIIEDGEVDISKTNFYVDGFSGFSKLDIDLLKQIAIKSKSLTISLFHEEKGNLVFACPNKTYSVLKTSLEALNCPISSICLDNDKLNDKEIKGPVLTQIEADFGAGPGEFNKFGEKSQTNCQNDLAIKEFFNSYSEIEGTAREIKHLLSKVDEDGTPLYKSSDIAVISSGVDTKASVIEAVFKKYDIDVFLDKKADISGHPLVRFVVLLMSLITGDSDFTNAQNSGEILASRLVAVIKTGLFKAEKYDRNVIDRLENMVLAENLKSLKTLVRFIDKHKTDLAAKSEYMLLCDFYNAVFGDDGLFQCTKGCNNISELVSVLNGFFDKIGLIDSYSYFYRLKSNGMNDDIDDNSKDQAVRVWNMMAETLKNSSFYLGNININGTRPKIKFLRSAIETSFLSVVMGFIPNSRNSIQIGNTNRSRYIDKKIVFILSANDGELPAPFIDSGILGDNERKCFKDSNITLAYDSEERAYFSQYNLYTAICMASEKLFVSYIKVDGDGNELKPASIISRLKKYPHNESYFSDIPEFETEDATDLCEADSNSAILNISSDVVKSLINYSKEKGEEGKVLLSVSSLEKYHGCPYSFLLNNLLKLKERDFGEIDSSDSGTLIHGVLEYAMKDFNTVKDSVDFILSAKESGSKFLMEDDSKVIKNTIESSNKNSMICDRAFEFAGFDLKNLIDILKETGFEPKFEELKFKTTENNKSREEFIKSPQLDSLEMECDEGNFLLNGLIDRVDLRKNSDGNYEFCIIDYKSSTHTLTEADIQSGDKLQLLTYYMVLKNNIAKIASYYNLDNAEKSSVSAVCYYAFGMANDSSSKNEDLSHRYAGVELEGTFDKTSPRFDSKNAIVSVESFNEFEAMVKNHIINSYKSIVNGNFNIEPRKVNTGKSKHNPCNFCSFKEICKTNR